MILHLKVLEAKDIPKMDVIGTADPFVIFNLSPSEDEYQTKVIKQNPRPVWNEEFHIRFDPNTRAILHMELFDWDKFTPNDLISTRDFEVSKYEPGNVIDEWYPFFAAPNVPKPGIVHLMIHVALPHEEPFVKRELVSKEIKIEADVPEVKLEEEEIEEEKEEEVEPPVETNQGDDEIVIIDEKNKYVEVPEAPLADDATEKDKEDFEYNHKIRNLTQMINTLTDGYLKPINFCYVDRLINIRGKKNPIAVFLKPVSSELSPSGVFVYDTTRMPKGKALYFFIGPESQKNLEKFGEQILQALSKESNCDNIIRIRDMDSPDFQRMIHQMGGHKRMILKSKNYGDELVFQNSFFAEKLQIRMFDGTKKTCCASIDIDGVPQNGALVINPSDFALYLYLDNIDPKNDEEKQSLITAIQWMKNQKNFDKRELFIFDKTRIPTTVQLIRKQ